MQEPGKNMTSTQQAYCCPEPQCERAALQQSDQGLVCPNGHFYPYVTGTEVPVFASQADDLNEYTIKNAAEIHDNSLKWVFSTFGTTEDALRQSLVLRLGLRNGSRLLVTGAGAGNDLPYMAHLMGGEGQIYAQDISRQMLLAGVKRHKSAIKETGVDAYFSVGDASDLPFRDSYFDAAYHFGGINLFLDIQKGIAEMNRVVRDGGKVVISDEGLAPWLIDTELGRMLIRNNALYACQMPLDKLPQNARNVKLGWELCNCFYVIEFDVSDDPLPIDIDVPHVGRRGGSIRTRYYGQLEGIDPGLKDRVYAQAEQAGVSRVEFIESLLREGLAKKDV